jgi:hypothetical protein
MTRILHTQAAAGVLPARRHGPPFVIEQTAFLLQIIESAIAIVGEQTDEREQQLTCSTQQEEVVLQAEWNMTSRRNRK